MLLERRLSGDLVQLILSCSVSCLQLLIFITQFSKTIRLLA